MQERAVCLLAACESTQRRPESVCESERLQHQVCVQTGHASVAVQERVNPGQAVMRRSGGDDRSLATAHAAVDDGPAFEEGGHRCGSGCNVFTDLDVSKAKNAWYEQGAVLER